MEMQLLMKHRLLDKCFDVNELKDVDYSDLCAIYVDQIKQVKNLSLEIDQRSSRISALNLEMRKMQNELDVLNSDDRCYSDNLGKIRKNAEKIFELINTKTGVEILWNFIFLFSCMFYLVLYLFLRFNERTDVLVI